MYHNHKKEMNKRMGAKISKIMHEGVRGKKVGQKQAVAIAASMLGIKKRGRKLKGKLKGKKKK